MIKGLILVYAYSEKGKKYETMTKLGEVLDNLRQFDEAVSILEDVIKGSQDAETKLKALTRVTKILEKFDAPSQQQLVKVYIHIYNINRI